MKQKINWNEHFANPAVTPARAASNTLAGICLANAPGFIIAQMAGATVAILVLKWLVPINTEISPYGTSK